MNKEPVAPREQRSNSGSSSPSEQVEKSELQFNNSELLQIPQQSQQQLKVSGEINLPKSKFVQVVNPTSNWKSVIVSFCILLLVFIFDLIFAEELYESNHELVLKIQQDKDHGLSKFWEYFTQLGNTTAVAFILVGFYLFYPNKIHSISTIIYISFVSFTLANLKLLYSEPRPYFKYTDINGYGCDSEFGKPSGHAMVSINLYFLLIDGFMRKQFQNTLSSSTYQENLKSVGIKRQENKQLSLETNKIHEGLKLTPKTWQFYVYAVVIVFVGFSRVYLGVHTYNQIILGWFFGQFMLTLYLSKLQPKLNEILAFFVYKEFEDKKQLFKIKLYITMAYIFLVLVSLGSYAISVSQVSDEEYNSWRSVINQCKDLKPKSFIYNKCLNDSVSLSVIYAMVMSILFTNGEYKPENFDEEHKALRFWKKILRVLIFGVISGGPLVFFKFFFTVGTDIVLVNFFVGGIVGSIIYGIFFVKILPFVYYKLNIGINGDLLRFTKDCQFFSCFSSKKHQQNNNQEIEQPNIKINNSDNSNNNIENKV